MRANSCAECLQAMANVKSDTLSRVACANCQQAQRDLALASRLLGQASPSSIFGTRCLQCGKWCWTKNTLATHQQAHGWSFR